MALTDYLPGQLLRRNGYTSAEDDDLNVYNAARIKRLQFRINGFPSALEVSKMLQYSVLSPPAALNVSKALQYSVLTPPVALNVSKELQYVVLLGRPNPIDHPTRVMRNRLRWPEEVEEPLGLNRRMFRYTSPDVTRAARVTQTGQMTWASNTSAADTTKVGAVDWVYGDSNARITLVGSEVWFVTPNVSTVQATAAVQVTWSLGNVPAVYTTAVSQETWAVVTSATNYARSTATGQVLWGLTQTGDNKAQVTTEGAIAWVKVPTGSVNAQATNLTALVWIPAVSRLPLDFMPNWKRPQFYYARLDETDEAWVHPRFRERHWESEVGGPPAEIFSGWPKALKNRLFWNDEEEISPLRYLTQNRFQTIFPPDYIPSKGIRLLNNRYDDNDDVLPITFNRGRFKTPIEDPYILVSWIV